jgi:hypothetical protein
MEPIQLPKHQLGSQTPARAKLFLAVINIQKQICNIRWAANQQHRKTIV